MSTECLLATMLQELVPEPPRAITVEQVAARVGEAALSGPGHRRGPLIAAVAAAACVAAVAVGIAAVRGSSSHRAPAVRPTTSVPVVTSPAPSRTDAPPPPANVADLRLVGANGSAAWKLTSTALVTTVDAGAHWSQTSLPAGVSAASVQAVTSAVGRGVWLLVPHGEAVDVYHQSLGSSTWARAVLVPFRPAGLNVGGASPGGSIYLGPTGIVTVVTGWGLTATESYDRFFHSVDDGATFIQHAAPTAFHVDSVTFTDAMHGVTVSGPTGAPVNLYRTADGGASWSPNDIPIDPTQQAFLGTPVAHASGFDLPMTVNDSSGGQQVFIYVSRDDGRSFTRAAQAALQIPAALSGGEVSVAIAGSSVWVPAQGRLYESIDAGDTWTTTTTNSSSNPISLIDASHAIGVATDAGCLTFKSDCHYFTYLVATADGGRTWHTI